MFRTSILISLYILSFILSTWIYIYNFRTEFIHKYISSSFPNAQTTIQKVEVKTCSLSSCVFTMKPVDISSENIPIFRASSIEVEISPQLGLFWALSPYQEPLPIESVTIYVTQASEALTTIPSSSQKPSQLDIKSITIITPEKNKEISISKQDTSEIHTVDALIKTGRASCVDNCI